MRNFFLLAVVVAASACAARAPQTSLHAQYACGAGDTVERHGDTLRVTNDAPLRQAKLGWHDGDGDHFVTWPLSTTDVEAVEYVMPTDRRADAVERVYDTSKGVSTADWRLTKRQVCTVEGGYSDVLVRFVHGDSIDDVAASLSIDRDEARGLVRTALTTLQKRYFRDR